MRILNGTSSGTAPRAECGQVNGRRRLATSEEPLEPMNVHRPRETLLAKRGSKRERDGVPANASRRKAMAEVSPLIFRLEYVSVPSLG
jgi:hypothetical protein